MACPNRASSFWVRYFIIAVGLLVSVSTSCSACFMASLDQSVAECQRMTTAACRTAATVVTSVPTCLFTAFQWTKTWGNVGSWLSQHFKITSSTVVCGAHFTAADFSTDVTRKRWDQVKNTSPETRGSTVCICVECHSQDSSHTAGETFVGCCSWSESGYVCNGGRPFTIIDATELYCEVPASLSLQSQCYSSYKSHTTMKGLVGIAPNGAFLQYSGQLVIVSWQSSLGPWSVASST